MLYMEYKNTEYAGLDRDHFVSILRIEIISRYRYIVFEFNVIFLLLIILLHICNKSNNCRVQTFHRSFPYFV